MRDRLLTFSIRFSIWSNGNLPGLIKSKAEIMRVKGVRRSWDKIDIILSRFRTMDWSILFVLLRFEPLSINFPWIEFPTCIIKSTCRMHIKEAPIRLALWSILNSSGVNVRELSITIFVVRRNSKTPRPKMQNTYPIRFSLPWNMIRMPMRIGIKKERTNVAGLTIRLTKEISAMMSEMASNFEIKV